MTVFISIVLYAFLMLVFFFIVTPQLHQEKKIGCPSWNWKTGGTLCVNKPGRNDERTALIESAANGADGIYEYYRSFSSVSDAEAKALTIYTIMDSNEEEAACEWCLSRFANNNIDIPLFKCNKKEIEP